jgi:16S rRNA (guanine527-N7)-methyltransferase
VKTTEVFERQLSDWGISIGAGTRKLLVDYALILSDYDEANVIGTREPDEILHRHILDSLSCLLFAPLRSVGKVADIGSGGGLPGIPLAVVLPEAEVTLIESVGKKVDFLRYATQELQLGNVRVVNSRIEEAAREEEHRGAYDVCTVRAVARLSVVAEYSLPLLRGGGYVIAMKAKEDEDERSEGERASAILGGRLCEEITVPQASGIEQRDRRLVVLEKVGETPDLYPRKTGTPAKAPLGREK